MECKAARCVTRDARTVIEWFFKITCNDAFPTTEHLEMAQ